VVDCVQQSVDFLQRELKSGHTIYGVTTGFGGSADTRTSQFEYLQVALQQLLNVGVLLPSDKGFEEQDTVLELLRDHAMPVAVVRAIMLIRCNSLLRGHSGVRMTVIQAILDLLQRDMTPVVPLRGSISASGDLIPLSYIAGAIEGNRDIFIRIGSNHGNSDSNRPIILPADKALERAGLHRVNLQAKEGLGITNGTAASCAAACIALHQAQQMGLLTQILTSMSTEALLGHAGNYDHFISSVRPHLGQMEAAVNIQAFLSGSKLCSDNGPEAEGLAQDRYALRTAPQWIGPQLEDLVLAGLQVGIELNSTTDNPLIDVSGSRIHHGGNFQAASLTSAMTKTANAMQNFGRLLHAQSSGIINNSTNKGLPPNLSADDPSLSFTLKGFDISMAAYMAELAYLAHPVQMVSAEMNNQSVNSMALVAARYTLEAVEVLSLMGATTIYVLCQALDLRCLHLEFFEQAKPAIYDIVDQIFKHDYNDQEQSLQYLQSAAWKALMDKWVTLSHLDLVDRGKVAVRESIGSFLDSLTHLPNYLIIGGNSNQLALVRAYEQEAADKLSKVYDDNRKWFFEHQTTPKYIGKGSKIIYDFVRFEMGIPMHRGIVDHPTFRDEPPRPESNGQVNRISCESGDRPGVRDRILGSFASDIYIAIRNGQLHSRIMKMYD
jgi:phenylalanine ammonia-lyase